MFVGLRVSVAARAETNGTHTAHVKAQHVGARARARVLTPGLTEHSIRGASGLLAARR